MNNDAPYPLRSPPRKGSLEGESEDSDDDEDTATIRHIKDSLPSSPALGHVTHAQSPIWAITSGADGAGFESLINDLEDLDIGSAQLDEPHPLEDTADSPIPEVSSHEIRQKEILITLPSDVAFFELLSQALTSLSALHDEQQAKFTAAVQDLCRLISASISPDSSVKLRDSLARKLPGKKKRQTSDVVPAAAASYTKSDLYAWREIFTLWIEAQIFESSSERDRGERSVEEAERRLKAFAAEVVKRGLGDRRTLIRKESRDAWAEFLRLNVLLLDLKRFQVANISAARKWVFCQVDSSLGLTMVVSQDLEEARQADGVDGHQRIRLVRPDHSRRKRRKHKKVGRVDRLQHVAATHFALELDFDALAHPAELGRLYVLDLHQHRLQADPASLFAPLLRPVRAVGGGLADLADHVPSLVLDAWPRCSAPARRSVLCVEPKLS